MITDANGQVLERHDYAPFGEPAPGNPPAALPGFGGNARDPETTFGYFGARYLASGSGGRFTSVDPGHIGGDVFDSQSWNAYAYARNNPLRFVDPQGTDYEIRIIGGETFTFEGSWADLHLFAPGFTFGSSTWSGDIRNAAGTKVGTYWWVPSRDIFTDTVRGVGDGSWESRIPPDQVMGASPFVPPIGRLSGVVGRTLGALRLLGPGTKFTPKILNQLASRGWTPKLVQRVIDRPVHTSPAFSRATGNRATAYFDRSGAYVVRDNVTGEIVQVSNRLNPSAWKPDASITNPFVP
jgi:RHS repeat-associated protein